MDNLLTRLSDLAEWADANEYEVPIDLGDTLREAAAEIRRLTAERDAKWISVKDRLPQFHKMDEYADQLVNVVARGSNGKLYSHKHNRFGKIKNRVYIDDEIIDYSNVLSFHKRCL